MPKIDRGWRLPDKLWQAAHMASPNPSAAGAPLALSIIVGAVIGSIMHQALIGAATGLAVGITIALCVWLWDRRKIGH
jgi:hypothetical protein